MEQDQGSPLTFTTYPSLLSVLSITLGVRLGSVSVSVVAGEDQNGPFETPHSTAATRTPSERPPAPEPPLPRTAARLTHTEPLPPGARLARPPRPAPSPHPRTHTWWGSAVVLGLRA